MPPRSPPPRSAMPALRQPGRATGRPAPTAPARPGSRSRPNSWHVDDHAVQPRKFGFEVFLRRQRVRTPGLRPHAHAPQGFATGLDVIHVTVETGGAKLVT